MIVIMARTIKAFQFLFNPHLILSFGMAWMITNGWAYLGVAAGTAFRCEWLTALSSAYLAFLWFPFTAEKIVTIAIAVWLLRKMFPGDEKTLKVLEDLKIRITTRNIVKTPEDGHGCRPEKQKELNGQSGQNKQDRESENRKMVICRYDR